MSFPRGVHVVSARGKRYFYFQPGRGTKRAGERVKLPDDPHDPRFWQELHAAQGLIAPAALALEPDDTVAAMIDGYIASNNFTRVRDSTQYQYRRSLDIARAAWGTHKAEQLAPHHLAEIMQRLANKPAKANAFLAVMWALAKWARLARKVSQNFTDGVEPYKAEDGHKPWSPKEIAAIEKLSGMVRRGVYLYLYTGQRGSDVVQLSRAHIDDGGFRVTQVKTRRPVWCPILPELEAEMRTWEKRPGPFLYRETGKPFTRKKFWQYFNKQRAHIPELKDVTLHGLRATAVINLRDWGLEIAQISNISGMSTATIQRYCRFADQKASGKKALAQILKFQKAPKSKENQ